MRLKPEQQYNIFYYYLIYTALLRVLLAKRAREAYLLSDTEDGPAGFLPNPRGASQASLGFEKIKTTDVNSGNYKIDTYHQQKPFHTMLKETRGYLANGTPLSAQISATPELWVCNESGCTLDPTNNPNPTQPVQFREAGEKEQRQYINGFLALITKSSIVSYDNYGNQLETRSTKQLGADIVTEHGYASYVNHVGDATHARAIGLPVTIKKCTEDCSIFNTSEDIENYYDNQPLGQIGLMRQLTSTKSKLGATILTRTMSYYANGNLHTETNDTTAVKSFVYDDDYQQFIKEVRVSLPSKPDLVMRQIVEPKFGVLVESTDINGTKTQADLDNQGRVIEERIISGANLLRRVSYEYHLTGNANPADHYTMQCAHRRAAANDDALGEKDCTYTYVDALNRKYLTISPATNGTAPAFTAIHTKYDNQGRATHISAPYWKDTSSNVGAPAHYAQTVFDNYGRISQQISTDSKVTATNVTYNAGSNFVVTQITSPDGTMRESTTDVRGYVKSVTEAKGSVIENNISYTYYPNGLLWQVTTPQGLTVIDYYQNTKQQKTITDPTVGQTDYAYENNIASLAFGKLLTETRPAPNGAGSVSITHEYNDAYGRLTKQIYSTGEIADYTYDESDVANGYAQLTRSRFTHNQQTIERRYAYSSLGMVAQTKTDISSTASVLCSVASSMPCHSEMSQEFDELGRKTRITYPDMKQTNISYFGGTQQIAAIHHNNAIIGEYSQYKATGQAQKLAYANGISSEYVYNDSTQLLENQTIKNSAQDILQDLDYTFYDSGNIHELRDNVITDASYTYEYDQLQRVKKATRSDGKIFNYAFDEKGNLTLKENRTQYYYPNSTKLQYSDLLTGAGTARTSFQWSASGNMLSKATPTVTQNFIYNGQHMMTESSYIGGTMTGSLARFFYDETGQRYGKVFQQPGKEEVKTYNLGAGFEVRETWNGASRTGFQFTKFIFGAAGVKLASLTTQPNSTDFLTQNSIYWQQQKNFYSGKTIDSLLAKTQANIFYFFYRVKEALPQHVPPAVLLLLISALVCILLWLMYLKHASFSGQPGLAATALAMCFVFFNVNCASNNDPAFANGAYTSIANADSLYLGLPSGTHFYSSNHLGSSSLITDASGSEVIRIHYLPYGEIDQNLSGKYNLVSQTLDHSAADAAHGYLGYRFTGQTYDPEAGLAYYNARYLDVTTGVMTSADTMVPDAYDPQAYNRHMYVRGNPVMYNDPTGHIFCALFRIGCGKGDNMTSELTRGMTDDGRVWDKGSGGKSPEIPTTKPTGNQPNAGSVNNPIDLGQGSKVVLCYYCSDTPPGDNSWWGSGGGTGYGSGANGTTNGSGGSATTNATADGDKSALGRTAQVIFASSQQIPDSKPFVPEGQKTKVAPGTSIGAKALRAIKIQSPVRLFKTGRIGAQLGRSLPAIGAGFAVVDIASSNSMAQGLKRGFAHGLGATGSYYGAIIFGSLAVALGVATGGLAVIVIGGIGAILAGWGGYAFGEYAGEYYFPEQIIWRRRSDDELHEPR